MKVKQRGQVKGAPALNFDPALPCPAVGPVFEDIGIANAHTSAW